MEPVRKTIGVLALQGAFREHRRMLEGLGADTRLVRWPSELERLDGLVIPGGESTAIAKLLAIHGMYGPLRAAHAAGMAVFGTCAGAILMARDIEGARSDQEPLALMDVRIRRNAYGRQIDSFETTVPWAGIEGDPVKGVFIRAPALRRSRRGRGGAQHVRGRRAAGRPRRPRAGRGVPSRAHRRFPRACFLPGARRRVVRSLSCVAGAFPIAGARSTSSATMKTKEGGRRSERSVNP